MHERGFIGLLKKRTQIIDSEKICGPMMIFRCQIDHTAGNLIFLGKIFIGRRCSPFDAIHIIDGLGSELIRSP
jgi:hypothetical protein